MLKASFMTNIASKKNLIISILSFFIAIIFKPKQKYTKKKHKKKGIIFLYKKTFSILSGIFSIISLIIIKDDTEEKQDDFEIEQAIIFDL